MRKSVFCFLTLLVSGFLSISCGEKDPDEWDPGDTSIKEDAGTDPKPFPEACTGFPTCGTTAVNNSGATDYFPLVDGSRWTYHHFGGKESNGSQKAPSCDSVRLNQTTHNGVPAFSVLDTPSQKCKVTRSIYIEQKGAVYRVYKDEFNTTNNCDPTNPACGEDREFHEDLGEACLSVEYTEDGFLRFDDAWPTKEKGFNESRGYYRTVLKDTVGDADPVNDPYDRWHTFTLEETGVTVNVPAGIFNNCIIIRRLRDREKETRDTKAEEADDKRFWFCPGVGKVKEVEASASGEQPRTEELVSYCIPGGLCCSE